MEARNQWGWGRQSDVFKFFTRTKGRYLVATVIGEYSFTHCVQTLDLQFLVWTPMYKLEVFPSYFITNSADLYGAVILEIIKL